MEDELLLCRRAANKQRCLFTLAMARSTAAAGACGLGMNISKSRPTRIIPCFIKPWPHFGFKSPASSVLIVQKPERTVINSPDRHFVTEPPSYFEPQDVALIKKTNQYMSATSHGRTMLSVFSACAFAINAAANAHVRSSLPPWHNLQERAPHEPPPSPLRTSLGKLFQPCLVHQRVRLPLRVRHGLL